MYDKEGWSLWICDYLYNDENKKGFMTANLVSGFIQRSDSLRKYAFGNMSILKSESEAFYRVKGAWLIRGRSIQPMLGVLARPSMEWRLTPTRCSSKQRQLLRLWNVC